MEGAIVIKNIRFLLLLAAMPWMFKVVDVVGLPTKKCLRYGEVYSQNLRKCVSCEICQVFPEEGICTECIHDTPTPEQKLLSVLFSNYNRKSRPIWNVHKAIEVSFTMTLTQISQLDERNQVLSVNVWIAQHWRDEKMTWEPAENSHIKVIRIPASELWLPDVTLYENADETGYMPNRESNALVYYNGNVSHWSTPTMIKSTCKITVRFFPFDIQTCKLKFSSWTYNSYQLNLINMTSSPDMTTYTPNEQWEVLRAVLTRNVVKYECCPETFPDVTLTLVLRRKPLYYLYNVIIRGALLSALSVVSFMVPFNVGVVKVTIGVMLLVSLGVFNLQVAETMPKTSEEIPLLGDYFTATMALISLSVALNVAVLNINLMGEGSAEAPRWLRFLVLDILGKPLCVRYEPISEKQTVADTKDSGDSDCRASREQETCDGEPHNKKCNYCHTLVSETGTVSLTTTPPSPPGQPPPSLTKTTRPSDYVIGQLQASPRRINSEHRIKTFPFLRTEDSKEVAMRKSCEFCYSQVDVPNNWRGVDMTAGGRDDAKRRGGEGEEEEANEEKLREVLEQDRKIRREDITKQWRCVATVIDRLFAVLFGLVTFIFSLVLFLQRQPMPELD